jgi:hypothetical protein
MIEKWRKTAKVTKFVEMEAEIDLQRYELLRMRQILENSFEQNNFMQRTNNLPVNVNS